MAMDADGLTLGQLASAKRLSIEFLRGLGVSDGRWQGRPAVRIGYRDEHDQEVTHQYRIALRGDRFRFPSDAKLIPYGIWRCATTNTPAWIFLVEGPSDCWTLWSHDIPAMGLPSASIWREEWTRYFEGIAVIYVVDEGDQGGQTLLGALARSAIRDRVRVVHLNGAKDPSELYLAAPEHFVERMAAARDAAVQLEAAHPAGGPRIEAARRRAAAGDRGDGRRSQATKLVELAQDVDCFHAPDSIPFARLERQGHHETWPLRSSAFRAWLAGAYYRAHEGAASSQAIRDALEVLAARALFDGPERPVFVRVAGEGGAIYLDLGDPEWRAVRITAAGWEMVGDPPVRFRRPKGLLALPAPVRGGSIDQLRPFVNVRDDDRDEQWHLFVGCLLAALRPNGPYPILALNGEQGTAKSTAARVHRRLIDPNKSATRPTPRDERDLAIAASNGAVISLDNLSSVPDWLSDALSRVSTGIGFGTRTLYENDEETLFDACRPIVINGIGVLGTRSDLLDRTIELELPRISDGHRRDETAFWSAFEREHPAILGALLDAVAGALARWEQVHLDGAPRMADFARWVVAAEAALSWAPGSFVRAYTDNRDAIHEIALDASLIVEPLRVLLEAGDFTGTATELLDRLVTVAGESAARRRGWPHNPTALSRELARIAPNLRAVGIEVDRGRTHGRRSVLVRTVRETSSPPSPVVPAERAGDAMPASGDAIAASDRPSVTRRPVAGDGGDAGDGLSQRVSAGPHIDGDGASRAPLPPDPPADEQMRWTE